MKEKLLQVTKENKGKVFIGFIGLVLLLILHSGLHIRKIEGCVIYSDGSKTFDTVNYHAGVIDRGDDVMMTGDDNIKVGDMDIWFEW